MWRNRRETGVLSGGVHLKSNKWVIGPSDNVCATIALACLEGQSEMFITGFVSALINVKSTSQEKLTLENRGEDSS